MSSILNTTYHGEDIEVHYTLYAGYRETLDCPGEPPTIEIDKIVYKGIDIMPIVEQLALDMFEGECMSDAMESAASDAVDRAEYRRESARDDVMEKEWGGI